MSHAINDSLELEANIKDESSENLIDNNITEEIKKLNPLEDDYTITQPAKRNNFNQTDEEKEREKKSEKIKETAKNIRKEAWYIVLIALFHPFGMVMRLYMTICEFFFCLYLFSFTLNCLIVCFSKFGNDNNGWIAAKLMVMIFISILTEKPLTMTFWEFIRFNWFNYKIFSTFQTVCNVNSKNARGFQKMFVNCFLTVVFFFYLVFGAIGALGGDFKPFDGFHFFIVFVFPAIKFSLIFILFFVFSIVSFCVESYPNNNKFQMFLGRITFNQVESDNGVPRDPFIISMFRQGRFLVKTENKYDPTKEKELFEKYVILVREEKISFIGSLIIIVVALGYIITIICKIMNDEKSDLKANMVAFLILFWLFISYWTLLIRMPFWFFTERYKGCNCFGKVLVKPIKEDDEANKLFRKIKDNVKGSALFPFTQYFFYVFEILIFLGVTGLLVMNKSGDGEVPLKGMKKDFNGNFTYDGTPFSLNQTLPKRDFVLNPLCFTKVHFMSFLQLSAISTFSYYNVSLDDAPRYLRENFFRRAYDKHYEDMNLTDLSIVTADTVVVLRAKLTVLDTVARGVIVYAIKGSSTGLDWTADFEMALSSAMNSVFSTIPILLMRDSNTNKYINEFITSPLKIMQTATVFGDYANKLERRLRRDIEENRKANESIIIVGHSLGGALSKMMGIRLGYLSVSFSGFGITPISYLFEGNKTEESLKTYKQTMIDIIPDLDVVPRLDQSGGVRYRLQCAFGLARCHYIKNTMCMIGISCRDDFYSRDICHAYLNEEDYAKMEIVSGAAETKQGESEL